MENKITTKITLLFIICMTIAITTFLQSTSTGQDLEKSRGQQLFVRNCTKCHGKSGSKGFLGAKDLTKSALSHEAAMKIILEGKGYMPSWKKRLTTSDIDDLIRYIFTLRSNN